MDLKEVLGWDAENLDQRLLDRRGQFPEADVVIPAFEHVDFGERHILISFTPAASTSRHRSAACAGACRLPQRSRWSPQPRSPTSRPPPCRPAARCCER